MRHIYYKQHMHCVKCDWLVLREFHLSLWTAIGDLHCCPSCGYVVNFSVHEPKTGEPFELLMVRFAYSPIWWNPITWFKWNRDMVKGQA